MSKQFRVWNVKEERFEKEDINRHFLLQGNGVLWLFEASGFSQELICCVANEHIVCKSTGIRDKNEKLIYEGDIVKLNGQVGTIVFECGAFGIAIDDCVDYDKIQEAMDKDDECCGNEFEGCMNDNFISLWEIYWNLCCIENYLYMVEVIGNIHENPELLEE
ncbi:YopX family protein [Niameybacter massiliensis]|uniref:YopX family protein n=1 Tax=Niameybacter massiliensis TaxID=1658108 RepID=UPI0006B4AA46|nr:YopX family protein [Niameybacter massiliensis]